MLRLIYLALNPKEDIYIKPIITKAERSSPKNRQE